MCRKWGKRTAKEGADRQRKKMKRLELEKNQNENKVRDTHV